MRKVLGAASILCFILAGIVCWIGYSSKTFPDWDTAALLMLLIAPGIVSGIWLLSTNDMYNTGDIRWAFGILAVLFVVLGAVWHQLGEEVWRYDISYWRWYQNEWWVIGWCLFLAVVFFVAWFLVWYYDYDPYKEPDVELQSLSSRYSPYMRPAQANKQAEAAAARDNLLTYLGKEATGRTELQKKQLEHKYTAPRVEEQRRVEKAATEAATARQLAEKKVADKASQKNLTPEAHVEIKKEKAISAIRIKEKDKDSTREINKTKELNEHGHKLELDRMKEQVRLAILADKLGEHQMIEIILEQMQRLYEKMSAVRANGNLDETAKTQILSNYEEYLVTLTTDRREREGRLVQADNRQRIQPAPQTANLRGDYREDPQAREE